VSSDELVLNPRGGFRFTRGTYFFAGGVVADAGFEIARCRLERPLPIAAGIERATRHVIELGRPPQSICGIELRAPEPYPTRQLFRAFNAEYVELLRRMDLLVDGLVPVTRANLAIGDGSVAEQCLYAFLHTLPTSTHRPTFATSAQADLKHLPEGAVELVAGGDTSFRGLTEKVKFVTERVDRQLAQLGVSWSLATHVRAYAVHPIGPQIADIIVPVASAAARHGITWDLAAPPVAGLDFELDVRAVLRDIVVDL
jgi:hypothetical protein